jgi:hypothetical protein
MLASCGGGSSMPPESVRGMDQQIQYDDSLIIDPRFLSNTANDFWICTYMKSGIIDWQAPVTFNEDGSGEAQFYGTDGTTYFTWAIGGTTLDMRGQDLSLTLFDLDLDTNPISRNQSYIGEIDASVSEGGSISCSKSAGTFFYRI